VFKAVLITKGRRSGREHAVWLRAVHHAGRIYFSRRNLDADWLKNTMTNPAVKVQIDKTVHRGIASLVTDPSLAETISSLKYPGEERAHEARVVVQVELDSWESKK